MKRISQFWKNNEEDSIINELPSGMYLDTNNFMQIMKQKEVEEKFQEFFSFNETPSQTQVGILKAKTMQENNRIYNNDENNKEKKQMRNDLYKENSKPQPNFESKLELISKNQ